MHLFKKFTKAFSRSTNSASSAIGAPAACLHHEDVNKAPSEGGRWHSTAPSTATDNSKEVPILLTENLKKAGSTKKPHKEASNMAVCPPYAVKSVVGQRFTMEDTWAAVPDLLSLVGDWAPDSSADSLPKVPPPPRAGSTRMNAAAAVAAAMASPQSGASTDDPNLTGGSSPCSPGSLARSSVGRSPVTAPPLPDTHVASPAADTARSPAVVADAGPSTTPRLQMPSSNSGNSRASGPAVQPSLSSMTRSSVLDSADTEPQQPFTTHFFAVYDGHGGAEVAKHCARRLHETLKDIVARRNAGQAQAPVIRTAHGVTSSAAPSDEPPSTPVCPHAGPALDFQRALEPALVQAFLETDQELGRARCANEVGSTAVASLLGPRHIWIANCGDSRAVLCRRGEAVSLSLDHKATRSDEVGRIEAAGGYVWWDRVMGELAISRAIGDHCLRPYVIAEPEVTRVVRRYNDELLILASDGLWDVLTSQEACTLALEKFSSELARGGSSKSAVKRAASSLVKVALQKGTRDNVTVLVVDVRSDLTPPPSLPLPVPSSLAAV